MTIRDALEVIKITNPEMRVYIFDDFYRKGVRISDVSENLLTKVDSDMLNREVRKIEIEDGMYDYDGSCVVLHANEDDNMADNKSNLVEEYHKYQEFIKLIGESTHDLLQAAGMMGKTNSIEDFVEFLYKNGYKIELAKDK
jgi:hypothetical protein